MPQDLNNGHKIVRVLKLAALLEAKPPKNIRFLADQLQTTERTVYRYLDLLEEIGFNIGRDIENRCFIPHESGKTPVRFTSEEAAYLHRLLSATGKKNRLATAILEKVHPDGDAPAYNGQLLSAHLGQIIERLSEAIHNGKQVVLKKYHSVNSNKIGDRRVEPIRFTDNYQGLVAYEPATGINKLFKIERISGVEVRKTGFRFRDKHRYQAPDVFGFSETGKRYKVEWRMSLRVAVLLREEYPMTTALVRYDKKSKGYVFSGEVYSLKPVTRFLLGFLDEVSIIGDHRLKDALHRKVMRFLQS
ncbi:MAG: helix-turn-helix transcriptional regulator [Bacteroidota bacterium]